ncbi:MAG: STAS domain-containing protein [Ignavibacteriales bacterium]|nr:STAS domain-containing protein [Ignavibacteriales bacterium]
MFKIMLDNQGIVRLQGRLDASQAEEATKELLKVTKSAVVDFRELEYISSAGLGVLIAAQKRLKESGHSLTLTNMNNHIRDVFRYARFDLIFKVE